MAQGFSSQAGQIGFKSQSVKGSFTDPGTGGLFVRLRSGSLGGNRDLLIPDPEIGGGRDLVDAYLGPVSFNGELSFYTRMETLAMFLFGALGDGGNSDNSLGNGAYRHDIVPTDSALPWFSVEERIGNVFETFRYTDAKVRSLKLEAEANGYLTGTVGLVALSQVSVGASFTASPDVDTTPMIVGSNITVTWDSVALPAKSFSFEINNGIETDDFRLGSLFLGDAVEKRREINMSVKIRPEDSDLWKTAMYGSSAATEATGQTTKGEITVTAETYEVIGTSIYPYKWEVTIPTGTIKPYAVVPSGEDVIEHDFEIVAMRPDVNDPILTTSVWDDKAVIF